LKLKEKVTEQKVLIKVFFLTKNAQF